MIFIYPFTTIVINTFDRGKRFLCHKPQDLEFHSKTVAIAYFSAVFFSPEVGRGGGWRRTRTIGVFESRTAQLYTPLCLSVRPSVHPSVRLLVDPSAFYFFGLFERFKFTAPAQMPRKPPSLPLPTRM